MLTQKKLKELFYYSEGSLYWKSRVNPSVNTERPAGCASNDARVVRVYKKLYLEHRLIFLFHYGFLPKKIDHIDGNRANNKIENLRECTSYQNSWNSKKPVTNTSGVKGVMWNKDNENWRARFRVKGKNVEVGSFNSIEDAKKAIEKKRKEFHGEFANNG